MFSAKELISLLFTAFLKQLVLIFMDTPEEREYWRKFREDVDKVSKHGTIHKGDDL